MISDEFRGYINIIKDDHAGMKGTGAAAAEFFRDAAAEGRDISPVVDDLIQVFLKCHQLPMLHPLAGAIALHYLNQKKYDELDRLLKKKAFGQYMIGGLNDLIKKGKDIPDLIPRIVKAFGYKGSGISRYDITNILLPYSKRSGKRLALVIKLMGEDAAAAVVVPWFINEYLKEKKSDLTEFIPGLLGLVKGPEDGPKAESAKAIQNIAYNGGQIQEHVPELEKLLGDKNDEVRLAVSFTLGSFYVNGKDMENAGRLASHPDDKVREGAVYAVNMSLKGTGIEAAEGARLLAELLTDQAGPVRERAANCLDNAMQNGVEFILKRKTLERLAEALLDAGMKVRTASFLYEYCTKDPERAKFFLETIAGIEIDKSDPVICRIIKAFGQKITGNFFPACEICKFLPAHAVYSAQYDVPKAFELLKQFPYGGLVRACPSCGAYYHYRCEEEWESPSDGMSVVTTITLRRLAPPEILDIFKGEELESYKLKYDRIIAGCVKDLDHFYRYAREHAAWDLLHHYLSKNMVEEIAALMRHSDAAVRLFVSKIFADKANDGDVEAAPFIEALKLGLSDTDDGVRRNCSRILGKL